MNSTGSYNVAVGTGALALNTTADSSTAVGFNALYAQTTGHSNVAVGKDAGKAVTTGNTSVFIGYQAGDTATTGTGNVCLGENAGSGQITTEGEKLYIAHSNTAAGNIATWIHGDGNGRCYMGNNQTTWFTTSDRRLKKNITDNTKGLAEINQLRVTNFEYRSRDEIDMSEFPLANDPGQVVLGEGNEGVHTGVIAQEIESVLPECIEVSDKGAKTVNADPIMWAMVNAIKELSAKVEELEAKLG